MRNGYQVEFMDESAYGRKQHDVRVHGVPTEIKVMEGYRNIRKRAEMASEQGASRVLYYIGFDDNIAMFKRFRNVHRTVKGIKEIGYVKNGKLHYYIDK